MERLKKGLVSAAAVVQSGLCTWEAAAKGRARVSWLVQAVAVATGAGDGGGSGRRQLRLWKTRARLWLARGREGSQTLWLRWGGRKVWHEDFWPSPGLNKAQKAAEESFRYYSEFEPASPANQIFNIKIIIIMLKIKIIILKYI